MEFISSDPSGVIAMELFDYRTFGQYYRGSWVQHPGTGVIYEVGDVTENYVSLSRHKERITIPKDSLDWKHVKCPELGYRTYGDGEYVYYASRRPGRSTSKGCNSNNVVLAITKECDEAANSLGIYLPRPALTEVFADSLFNPRFMPLDQCLRIMQDVPSALGFALSPSWAVCIGTTEGAEYILLLKDVLVATSTDGHSWDWLDPTAEELFNRSSVR